MPTHFRLSFGTHHVTTDTYQLIEIIVDTSKESLPVICDLNWRNIRSTAIYPRKLSRRGQRRLFSCSRRDYLSASYPCGQAANILPLLTGSNTRWVTEDYAIIRRRTRKLASSIQGHYVDWGPGRTRADSPYCNSWTISFVKYNSGLFY